MDAIVTYLDPQPGAHDVPARMPSPFVPGPPCPLAQRAAERLRAELPAEVARTLETPGGGKMFGVLVVADREGRIGFLRGFSGMVGRSWHLPGFVPPTFDEAARDAFWIAGEAELDAIAARIADVDAQIAAANLELAALDARRRSGGVCARRGPSASPGGPSCGARSRRRSARARS